MFEKNLKSKYKSLARKRSFIISFFTTNVFSFACLLGLKEDFSWVMILYCVLLSVIVSPFYAIWSNRTKKQYFKYMQKHIMESIVNASDSLEVQKLQVAMTYYGNQMSATQMKEIKAAASASAYSSASASANAEVHINNY